MNAGIQAEYDRIERGPHKGHFTFLHHNGPIVEYSKNIMERMNYIFSDKDSLEHYTRLRHIYFVPAEMAQRCEDDAQASYNKARDDALVNHDKIRYDAEASYNKACEDVGVLDLIPDCRWNGRTIFAKRR